MGIALPTFSSRARNVLLALVTDVRWGYWCVAIMIAPSAAVATLYPVSWMLGSVPFNTNFVDVGWLKILMIFPLLTGAFISQANKNWLLALMLMPGLLLMLTAPDHLGAIRRTDLTPIQYYPEVYDAAVVSSEIDKLDQSVNEGGWLFSVFPPQVRSTENLRTLNATAAEAKGFWRDALDVAASAAGVQGRIDQLKAQNNQLQKLAGCNFRATWVYVNCGIQARQTMSANTAQIQALGQQLASMQNAPTPESRYAIAVAAASSAKVEFQMVERQIREKRAFVAAFPYLLASSVAFILLIYLAGFRSSTLGILLISTATIGIVSNLPIRLDDQIVDGILVFYPVFLCVAAAFVLRFLFRAYLDNRIIGKRVQRERVLNSLLITFLLWLPFPVVVSGVLAANQWIYSQVSSIIYCTDCTLENSSFPIFDSDPSRDTLRDDVNAGISRQFAKFEAEALENAAAAKDNTPEVVKAAGEKVMATFRRILPPNIYDIFPNLKPPSMSDCIGWLYIHPSCFAKKIAYEKLNDAYRRPRNRLEQRLQAKVTEISNQVNAAVASATDSLQASVKGEAEAAATYTAKAVDATFLGFNVFSVSQMAIMLAVAMRAFLLAFGRVLYRPPGPIFKAKVTTPYLTLGHSDPVSPEGDEPLMEYPDKCKVAHAHTPLIVKRAYSAADAKQSTVMWRSVATRWPLRRLRNRCLFLKRVEAISPSKRLSFSSGEGRSYVAWTIQPGTKIFFDWTKFVAMSEHLALGKDITLRIGGLTLGTTMHASLTAHDREGVLILESGGKVTFFHQQANPTVDSPFRLMAWRDDAAFKIVSPVNLTNVYLDGPSIDPRPKTARGALDTGRDIPTFGILRELGMLLRP